MTHLGVEFVKISMFTCLGPNQPHQKKKNKMDRSPSIKTCQKHMGDISSGKRKVQKKEIQDDSFIQSNEK